MKTLYTTIDPIPSHIPRQLAIELLHSHGEIISLNPLVLEYHPIKAPRDAPNDEFYSTWYEIEERIQFMPGIGKMGSSKVKFRGCFHDMPWGVQTHMYVPMGIDLRHKYQIKGNQPGEPPEPKELGSNAPVEGLYLRVDVQIKCNVTMLSFVKKELKAASKTMIDRMVKKAELIDAGVLQAMFDEDGKLKTLNPHDRTSTFPPETPVGTYSPGPASAAGNTRWQPPSPSSTSHRQSQYYQPGMQPPSSPGPYKSPVMSNSSFAPPQQQQQQQQRNGSQGGGLAIMEMPGDMHFPAQSPGHLHPQMNNRYSSYSELSGSSPRVDHERYSSVASDQQSNTGSVHSRPTSYSQSDSMRSPRQDTFNMRSFAAELPDNEMAVRSPVPQTANPGPTPPPKEQLPQQYQHYSGDQQQQAPLVHQQ